MQPRPMDPKKDSAVRTHMVKLQGGGGASNGDGLAISYV